MMQNTLEEQKSAYEAFARKFREEAISLISEGELETILARERLRFEAAGRAGLSPNQVVGGNLLRYCKDLLRSRQPLPWLYSLLCFTTELSMWMLLYGLLASVWQLIFPSGTSFLSPVPYAYPLAFLLCLTIYFHGSKACLCRLLNDAAKEPQQADNLKTTLKKRRLFLVPAALFSAALLSAAIFCLRLSPACHASISTFFMVYVFCMVLSGIHNTIYSSHAISLLSIGIAFLSHKPREAQEELIHSYMKKSYVQLLGQAHSPDAMSEQELQKRLRSRLGTQRIFYALALALSIALDILGILKVTAAPSALLILFTCAALLITACLFVPLVSVWQVLRSL